MYRTNKVHKMDDKFLYHFTNAESFLKILKNMTLRFSTFENLNDLNETDINCNWSNSFERLDIEKYIKEHCQLLSFSQNYLQENNENCEGGYNHPRMWAQYAKDSSGVCIAINENKFLIENGDKLNNIFYKIDNVKYDYYLYDKKITFKSDSRKFIEEYYQHLFFKKHIDWSQEGERRLFCIDGPEYLSIENCIEYIVLGRRFREEHYFDIANILIHSQLNLTPHNFVKQSDLNGQSVVFDIAWKIIEIVKKMNNASENYLEYLQKNGYKDLDRYY